MENVRKEILELLEDILKNSDLDTPIPEIYLSNGDEGLKIWGSTEGNDDNLEDFKKQAKMLVNSGINIFKKHGIFGKGNIKLDINNRYTPKTGKLIMKIEGIILTNQ